MVFDLNTTNNLPQSSTSSCTDYFYDGCYSKSQNNCHIQYQNCQCRPCCINSVLNDHTYSLLKKICRKVFRDYHRQKNREKYTIFDGGNSVNVRIHRSSFVPGQNGKCKSLHADSSLSTLGGSRRKYGKERERNNDIISEKSERGTVIRKNVEKGKPRKSVETFDTKHDRQKKGQDKEDEKHEIERKGKGEYDDDSDIIRKREKKRGKEEDYNTKGKKGKKIEDGDKRNSDKSGKNVSERKKPGANGDGDRNDDKSIDDKISEKKSEKNKKKKRDEDNDNSFGSRNIEKLDKSKRPKHEGDEVSRPGTKERKNKQRDSNEDRTSIRDRDGGKMREGVSKDEGKGSRSRQGNDSKDDHQKGDRLDGVKDIQKATKNSRDHDQNKHVKKNGNESDWFNSSKDDQSGYKGHTESDRQDQGRKDMRSQVRDPDNTEKKGSRYRDNQMKGSKNGGHRGEQYSSARNSYHTDHKGITRKRKDVRDLPVISDLRTKVRKGHDVMPVRKQQIGKHGYRSITFLEGGNRKKIVKPELKRLIKESRDRINERHENRIKRKSSGRGRRTRFGVRYGNAFSSRCDEIRPCDILRAHMEQRELCEKQKTCCLQCSCDCSAVYCPAPTTICSRIC
ncbi:uncharacterized protein DDB_G0283697-like [Bactrocera tryoni]|uniref:uncharacterized protein DDB_G0283697-like n=1 Tax=Bactrocera tryoni TaxID=59916 RepID=UPI001A966A93|nr:uncharacterized protein DDB_G0283697-like [Bactrocera tryoni]